MDLNRSGAGDLDAQYIICIKTGSAAGLVLSGALIDAPEPFSDGLAVPAHRLGVQIR